MSESIYNMTQYPEAHCFVVATDRFMSNWGAAEGVQNDVVLPCTSYAEAKVVADNARSRSEMKNVRIRSNPPCMNSHVLYSLMSREGAARWYEPGGFS